MERDEQEPAAASTEENWSALSNLRVAGEDGDDRPASSRHKVRRTSSQAHPTTAQDDAALLHDLDAVSKSSLSFILDDQAASAAAGKPPRHAGALVLC
ncbi:unnamed protein product [Phytophthora lilii]|uniref:Unnamed protein product n=1 Tax=Phytophthora lilii TaxID=2077276 RepID=A0A9W6THP9_9STRA|nr:unnamed protein product [Phytophthora lilii]